MEATQNTEASDLTKTFLYAACPEAFESQRFEVIDTRSGAVMGTYTNKRAARARRDRLDLQYGAIRYAVRAA